MNCNPTSRPLLKNFDAIIIGSGVIGCSISLSLSREKLRTLNIDTLPAAGYGSTSHSSAIIRPFYSHTVSCALAHEARHRWVNWREHLDFSPQPIARYVETGGLILIRDGTEHEYENNLTVLKNVGVEFAMLSPKEIIEMYPGISLQSFGPPKRRNEEGFGAPVPGEITGGIFMPESGYVSDPQLATTNLRIAAEHNGANFRFNITATSILKESGKVSGVRLSNGEIISAPILINAAGPHSSTINELAGIVSDLAVETKPHRHEVVYLKATEGYRKNAGFVLDLDSGVYQKPSGTDMVIGSADPKCDTPEVVHPDSYDNQFTDQWTTQALRTAQRWPKLGIENNARGTVGLYDVSNDWIPIYDRTDLPGFYLAIGTSGNQFKNAPIVGDLMARIIENPDHDHAASQLLLNHLGRTIDLSFYSRNREIKQTASVMA